jgi:hypothetical protein
MQAPGQLVCAPVGTITRASCSRTLVRQIYPRGPRSYCFTWKGQPDADPRHQRFSSTLQGQTVQGTNAGGPQREDVRTAMWEIVSRPKVVHRPGQLVWT